jgi:hypothetical protein
VSRWATLLPRQGGGRTIEVFNDKFFDWWAREILVIKDYPYAGINFLRDPDMPVPPEEERGEIGNMHFFKFIKFLIFIYILFMYV